ncbi:VOC family protein [Streptomyces sp. NPDC090445]|uniref:VOC family protein n=1 Tax=Streptomyces sp. NPDC090445 TaxID=3365963 RepID=UPI0037FB0CBB
MTVQKTPVIALDCADPKALAQFYADLLGGDVRPDPSSDGVEVVGAAGVRIACRRDAGFAPPSWPRPEDSQQAHLRIEVAAADLDEAEREAVSLGARPLATSSSTGIRTRTGTTGSRTEGGARSARLLSDPAGHTFLLTPAEPAPDPGIRT